MRNAPDCDRVPAGLFVGLATLDVIHHIGQSPAPNQKITASTQFVSAGGPAANAAITFAALGGRATLVTALGEHPVAELVRSDLVAHGVEVVDAAAGTTPEVPVSAVSVLERSGDRSVVSLDALTSDVEPPPRLPELVAHADVVLVDGHHPRMARAGIRHAVEHRTRVVVDAGRWKPVMDDLVDDAADMVCSADFRVPGATTSAETAAALVGRGVATVVVTHGGDPVQWWADGGSGTVPVPPVRVVDTLGAGDAFHGAYCFYAGSDVVERIEQSVAVAALRVSHVGPRTWLSEMKGRR